MDKNGWYENMKDAPKDCVILVWLPQVKKPSGAVLSNGYITTAKWCVDERDERSEDRHNLMMKFDGYWAHGRAGSSKPLSRQPSHWRPNYRPPVGVDFKAMNIKHYAKSSHNKHEYRPELISKQYSD